ncbi:MAG TPA: hypothetical protein VK886_09375 [Vicinamibacterales bacterium]|nr:hypothetical protein [Vicinamibacterales bacterium]
MTHLTEEDLTLLYYGETSGGDERDARAHLASCAACRQAHDELLRLFAMVDSCPTPEPGPAFETEVWRRLQPALRAGAAAPDTNGVLARLRGWLVPGGAPRWAVAGGIAMVLVLAFAAGRYWPDATRPSAPATQSAGAADQADLRERILLTALGDHFDRTQGMLVELASAAPSARVDISNEQRRAGDLLAATRIYRRAAIEAGDRNVADVLDSLERVLVEVTVSPAELSAFELQSLQKRIETQELLFKLRVAASTVRDREEAARPPVRSAGA